MSSCVKSGPSPPALPKPESRRSKRLHHSAVTPVEENDSLSEFPEVKDRSSLSKGVQMPVLPPQNGQNYFIPDELISTLTSAEWQHDRVQYNKTRKHSKVCGIRAPDAVWHHSVGRKKYHYFLDQPTSVTGAGRDISFLCDALASQREQLSLPPVPDRTTISLKDSQKDTHSTQTLIPEEYHILTNKGVKALQCYDDKFTVLLEDEQKRLKNFPSMKPSGRLEAVQLMRVMDDMLEKAGASQELEVKGISQIQGLLELVQVEQNIYNIVFHELIRQVSVECIERGQLLAKLRHRYVALLDRIPRQLIDLHTETLAQRALDRRLTEEIICFKHSIAQLNEELNLLREHDEHVSKQAEKAQEELAKALKQSQLDSDIVGEYHKLYELQRQRLEGQIIILTEERDLWSKVTYSIALKVIKLNNLQLVSRLHLSEQAWSETAEHFTTVLTAKVSEDLKCIMQQTDQWKEQLTGFMENLRETENKQYESIRSVQDGLVRWHKHCQDNVRSPDVKLEKTSEELLLNDLKQWSMALTMQCERYGGEELLTFQETLHTLGQLQDLWVEMCVQLFMRHPSWDGEAPKGPEAMRELSRAINELHTQLGIRISGESGIHQQLVTLAGVIESWANRLNPLIGQLERLHDSEWSKLEKALESWINLCEEALGNVSNTQTESDRIKHKSHTKIEIDEVLNMLREFVSSQNNFYDHTNLTLCDEVGSLHVLRTRWMVDLLLLMVPDESDAQDLHPPPSPELNAFRDVSYQKLEDDAKSLEQKLNYFSKYIANSCQTIVEEMVQKNMPRTDTENEVYHLNKLQRECAEWVDVCQILLCDLMGCPLKLQLAEEAVPKFITDLSLSVESAPSLADVYEAPERPAEAKEEEKTFVKADGRPYTPLQMNNKQVEEMREDGTEDQKSSSVMKLIGHDGHIIEQILEGKTVRITGTSDHVVRPYTENAQQAFSALGTLGLLQQELLAVEARAVSAEERALKAEEALQEALEKIHDLERQLPQITSLETEASETVSPDDNEEAITELKEVSQQYTASPKSTKSSKKH